MPPVVVMYLEMHSLADLRAKWSADPQFVVREATMRQWQVNRFLYYYVGGEWQWYEKRTWPDDQWQTYVDRVRTFVACHGGALAGYYELERDEAGQVQIMYFGLTPPFVGRGFGAALLSDAITNAWSWDARRVWVHTCTLDHPAAVRNYQARGMKVYDVRKKE
jgi:GNAT superfamily N-acetyltransferase